MLPHGKTVAYAPLAGKLEGVAGAAAHGACAAGWGFKAFATVGLLNACFYSATISTASFPSQLTGLAYGGEPLLLDSIEHTQSLEKYPHYLLYIPASHSTPLVLITLVLTLVQLAVTMRGMVKHIPSGLPCDLVAFYSWCFSASLVLVGAFAKEQVHKVAPDNELARLVTMSVLAFFGWWHVFYDMLIPLGLHLNPTKSPAWDKFVRWGCFPFALLAVVAALACARGHDDYNDFYQNLNLNILMNLQLFAHGCYWLLVTFRAWTGASCGSGPPAIQKYLNYMLAFHALYDMSNEYVPNPPGSNDNTSLYLAAMLLLMNLSFFFYMREYEKLVLAKPRK